MSDRAETLPGDSQHRRGVAEMPIGVGENQTRALYEENCQLRRRLAELEGTGQAGHPGYLALLRDMATLHSRKAADYGSDTDPLANIRSAAGIGIEPWRAAWLRAHDKVHRINRFCQTGTLANEGVEDSLMDLAAYSLIALVLLRERQPARPADLEAKTV